MSNLLNFYCNFVAYKIIILIVRAIQRISVKISMDSDLVYILGAKLN